MDRAERLLRWKAEALEMIRRQKETPELRKVYSDINFYSFLAALDEVLEEIVLGERLFPNDKN